MDYCNTFCDVFQGARCVPTKKIGKMWDVIFLSKLALLARDSRTSINI